MSRSLALAAILSVVPGISLGAASSRTLPPWIASISPTLQAQSLAQIRVIFRKPVTTLGALEQNGSASVLAHFHIEPALRGNFVAFTPRMIGFVPEQALPIATRVRVTLTKGLRDLDGDSLPSDLTWTFETAPLELSNFPTLSPYWYYNGSLGLHPTFQITANAKLDIQSLTHVAGLVSGDTTVPLAAKLEAQPTPLPWEAATAAFDPSLNSWTYDLTPTETLRKATQYRLVIMPGVAPAHGNMRTRTTVEGGIQTYYPLQLLQGWLSFPQWSSDPFHKLGSQGSISFDNRIDSRSVRGNVTFALASAPSSSLRVPVSGQGGGIAFDPSALLPRTSYVVTFGTGLRDTFGQHLLRPLESGFQTPGYAPFFSAPAGLQVVLASTDPEIDATGMNVVSNRYLGAFALLTPTDILNGIDTRAWPLPTPSAWSASPISGAAPDVISTIRLPLRGALHGTTGALQYGVGAALDAWHPDSLTSYTGVVSATKLNVVLQTYISHAVVRVSYLSDGSPVPDATVSLYPTGWHTSRHSCAHGTTDASGALILEATAIAPCYRRAMTSYGPSMFAVARDGGDWAFANLDPMNPFVWYPGGVGNSNWSSRMSRNVLFTDRGLYRAGEDVRVTGVAYVIRNGVLSADSDTSYSVGLYGPNSFHQDLGNVKTDSFGVFSVQFSLARDQDLGDYRVVSRSNTANWYDSNYLETGFQVQEFKPPNFKVDLGFDRQYVVAGSAVRTTARAEYLFGAPLTGAEASITVKRYYASPHPPGWNDYVFGRQFYWPDQPPSFDPNVLTATGSFDRSGKLTTRIAVARALPFPMTYSVDVQATDISHKAVDTTENFTAFPDSAIIGLGSDFWSNAGQPLRVRVITVTPKGTPVRGRRLWVQIQNLWDPSDSTDVLRRTIVSGEQPVILTFFPKESGAYEISANFQGAAIGSETNLQAFVSGSSASNSGAGTTLTLKLDRPKYQIGETATALVASPFSQSDIYFQVIKHDVLFSRTLHVSGTNAQTISFPVTSDMMPNAILQALVVRRGAPLAGGPLRENDVEQVAFEPLHVDLSTQTLDIGIKVDHTVAQPGSTQRIALHITDFANRPEGGEAVVMVVDDAVLQLTGYRPPDLVSTVLSDQPTPVRYADNWQSLESQTRCGHIITLSPDDSAIGSRIVVPPVLCVIAAAYAVSAQSAQSAPAPHQQPPVIRHNFNPLACYAIVNVDTNGNASMPCKLPDGLTTWRVMALALGNDNLHFGNADSTFITRRALVTNPLLPQFARPGDIVDAGLSVMNASAAGKLRVYGHVSGGLSFENGRSSYGGTERLRIGMQAFRFPVRVTNTASSRVLFAARTSSGDDAFEVPLDIRNQSLTESVIDAGAISGTRAVPIDLSPGGTLSLTLANSVVPQFALPSAWEMNRDPLPFLDDAAGRLIIAVATTVLQSRYDLQAAFDIGGAERDALRAIASYQNPDGSFSQGQPESPFETGFAVEALAFARSHRVHVNGRMISRAADYLRGTLKNPRTCPDDSGLCNAQVRLEMLLALDELGETRTDYLPQIIAQAPSFDVATQARLALYLLGLPAYRDRGELLAQSLDQILYRTGKYSYISMNGASGEFGSQTEAQSRILQLLIAMRAEPDEIDGVINAMVTMHIWDSIGGDALAMEALTTYALQERLSAFSATAGIGTRSLANVNFGSTASSQTLSLAATSLGKGSLFFQADRGTLHYSLLYQYPIGDGAPGVLAGLRVIRIVRPVFAAAPVATMDLASLRAPVSVSAGTVFDIGVRVIADHPVDRVVIEDPLPAGFEAINESFRTSSTAAVPQADSWNVENQQIYADRVTAYAQHLDPGVYEMHYLVRAVTPGRYRWPGARAFLRDAPEEFGRSAFSTLIIR